MAKEQAAPDSLSGVLERIIFFNEENHFCIGEFRPQDKKETVTITGALPSVQCGETLELSGLWTHHPQHGAQFKVSRFQSRLPADVYGIRKYLGSGLVPGIGKVYANKIVDHFGKDTLRVIAEESARLREVPGIGAGRAKSIKKAWDEQAALREVMMFLKTYGVGTAQCLKLVREYGNQAKTILQNEPYRIAREIDQIGFKTADRIALNLGFSNDGAPRVQAGILHALHELEDEGHTCVLPEDLVAHASSMLEVNPDVTRQQLNALAEVKELISAPSGILQSPQLARHEQILAQALLSISRSPSILPSILVPKAIEWAQERAGFDFAPEQAEAIAGALSHKLSVLTGGPGTGKTTILRALVDILKAKKVRLCLAAPTGRAAQRMSEATRHFSQTIHRLLEYDPSKGGFLHREDHPLAADFVVVDEASMLDTRLASALIRAIPAQAHLLLVGDIFQLPSVGAGNVLGDLIDSGIAKVTRLETIFRQGRRSGIVRTAHGILQGNPAPPPPVDAPEELDLAHDMHFVRAEDPDVCVETVLELAAKTIPTRLDFSNPADVQVLAPMHKGSGGIGRLNAALQEHLNPDKRVLRFGANSFAAGDKVMQTRNNYDKQLFNGDIGVITTLNPESGTLTAQFDKLTVELERSDLSDLQLAYAISIHKSQGSEFPVVIIPLLKQHFVMLQRNLLYTAITRGRKKVIVVGDPVAYAMAVKNTQSTTRRTALIDKISAMQDIETPD